MLGLLVPGKRDSAEGATGLSQAQVHLSHVASAVGKSVGGKGSAAEGTGKTRRCFQHACIDKFQSVRDQVTQEKVLLIINIYFLNS